jgi:hypothetical protein
MTLEITVFLNKDYKQNETFTLNVIGDIVTHKGKGREKIIKEVEKRFPSWYSLDIKRTENQEVTKDY